MPLEQDQNPTDDYADFSSVFASLTDKGPNDETNSEAGEAAGAAGAEGDAQQPTQQADGAGGAGEPAQAGEDPPADDAQGVPDGQGGEPAGGDAGSQGVDWEARFRELEARINQPPAPAAAPTEPAAAPEIYSADEKAELAELQKEWPDLHRLFSLMARQVQVDTLNYAFSEVGKVLQPLQESVTTYSTNEHMGAIYEAHEDYDQVYQPVMEWIEKQPSFLKAAYQNVVKEGNAEDVVGLIQRFKDETKWVAPAAGAGVGGSRPTTPAGAASAPTQQQTGLSEAAKKAAKAMGAVGGKRGAAAGAQDPNDFDGAWDEANAA